MAGEIAQRLEELGATVERDEQGNVWTTVAGTDPDRGRITLAGHLDELALVVVEMFPDGSLGVRASGRIYPWKLGEAPVTILGDGPEDVSGLLGVGSVHTIDRNDPVVPLIHGSRGADWIDFRIMTGLSKDELFRAGIRPGSMAVPAAHARGPHLLGPPDDPLVSCWLLDNRGGSVTLLRLLEKLRAGKEPLAHDLTLLWTTQEETGLVGARAWARRNRSKIFLAVDSTPITRASGLALDGNPAAWSKTTQHHFDQSLLRELSKAATEAGCQLQHVAYTSALSDANAVLDLGAADRVGTIGYPRENSHGYEVCRLSAFEKLADTLEAFLRGVH